MFSSLTTGRKATFFVVVVENFTHCTFKGESEITDLETEKYWDKNSFFVVVVKLCVSGPNNIGEGVFLIAEFGRGKPDECDPDLSHFFILGDSLPIKPVS